MGPQMAEESHHRSSCVQSLAEEGKQVSEREKDEYAREEETHCRSQHTKVRDEDLDLEPY
jgi:hypothetical protein